MVNDVISVEGENVNKIGWTPVFIKLLAINILYKQIKAWFDDVGSN